MTDAEIEVLLFPVSVAGRPKLSREDVEKLLARKRLALERVRHTYAEAHLDGDSFGQIRACYEGLGKY